MQTRRNEFKALSKTLPQTSDDQQNVGKVLGVVINACRLSRAQNEAFGRKRGGASDLPCRLQAAIVGTITGTKIVKTASIQTRLPEL